MRSRSIIEYLLIGGAIRYLFHAEKGFTIKGDLRVLDNIKSLMTRLNDNGLVVTARLTRNELGQLAKELGATQEAALTADQAKKLADSMARIERTLYAEADGLVLYEAREGRYSSIKLLDRVDELFGPGVLKRLDSIAVYDFRQAGVCIALELPTSAAFHLLRAAEAVIRQLHRELLGSPPPAGEGWFQTVDSLGKAEKQPVPQHLINDLDHLREAFRNPTQHPEKVYDIEEAQDLLGRVIDVTNQIAKLLPSG